MNWSFAVALGALIALCWLAYLVYMWIRKEWAKEQKLSVEQVCFLLDMDEEWLRRRMEMAGMDDEDALVHMREAIYKSMRSTK